MLGLLALLPACAKAPAPVASAPPTSRLVAGAPPVVLDRVAAVLTAQGFAVTGDRASGSLKASREDASTGWAACPSQLIRDPDSDGNRQSFARAEAVRTVVVVRAMPLGASTELSLDLLLAGRYRNPYLSLTFEEPCPSTGRLEALVLAAGG